MREGSFNAFMTYLFLRGSDQPRYGSMGESYRMAFGNKKDEYPKIIHDMIDVMRQMKPSRKNSTLPKNNGDK